jgi:5'-nucleotidase
VAETTATTAPAAADTVAPTTEVAEPLQILVTNDDGIGAPGIDALVTALTALPDVEVTVVAPAENQSGTSMSLTDGELTATPATTASGYPATSVQGFPADSVRWAVENLDTEFDLVVSGSNTGQNIGDFSGLSGTVGAARYGAQQGIPAVAVSQGFVAEGNEIVYDVSVAAAIEWIVANRADYESGAVSLTSINAPTCPDGGRGSVVVPLGAFNGRDPILFDCASTLESPVDDVDAFANGFVAVTDLPIQV